MLSSYLPIPYLSIPPTRVSFSFGAFSVFAFGGELRLERRFQHLEGGVHRIDAMHQARILRADRAPVPIGCSDRMRSQYSVP